MSPLVLIVGGGGAVVAAVVIAVRAVSPATPVNRLAQLRQAAEGSTPGIDAVAGRLGSAGASVLDRTGRREAVESLLRDASVDVPAGTVVAAVSAGALLLSMLGLQLLGPAAAVLLPILAVAAVVVILRSRRAAQRSAFQAVLPEMLQLLSGSLRVGHGLLQAVETASHEAESPVGDELRRALSQVRLGRDLVQALADMADRMHSDDFHWVVQAIGINLEVGGDLAGVLDNVAATIRARAHLDRQVKTLSAEGRISAYVLLALPFGLAMITMIVNPDYMGLLFTRTLGFMMLGLAGVLMMVGALWLRRLCRPVY